MSRAERARWRWLAGALAWACAGACQPAAEAGVAPLRSRFLLDSPEVLWGGCREVVQAEPNEPPVCMVWPEADPEAGPPRLRLWVPAPYGDAFVSLDGESIVEVTRTQGTDGTAFEVAVRHDGRLRVQGGRHVLELEVRVVPQPYPEVAQRRRAGEDRPAFIADQRARLDAASPPIERLVDLRHLRIALFDEGAFEESAWLAEREAILAHGLGRVRQACDALFPAVYTHHVFLSRPARARELLDSPLCSTDEPVPAENRMWRAYYEGLVEQRSGHTAIATRRLLHALTVAQRMRWPRWEQVMLAPLVDVLATQGRFSTALQVLEHYQAIDDPKRRAEMAVGCMLEASYHEQRADLAQRALRSGDTSQSWDPEAGWREALAVYEEALDCGEDTDQQIHAARLWLKLAQSAADRGDLALARRWSLDAEGLTPPEDSRELVLRRALLHATVAIAEGQPQRAISALGTVEDRRDGLGDRTTAHELRWRAWLLRARAQEATGELDAALASLDAADGVLTEMQRDLEEALSLDRHASMHRDAGVARVRIRLAQGDVAGALCDARLARVRGLATAAGLSPRELDCDALTEPGEGELALLFHHGGDQWLGFAWAAEGPPVVRAIGAWQPHDSATRLGEVLLEPFAEQLRGVRHLRLVLAGSTASLPFETFAWRGEPLAATMAVAYALDLPSAVATAAHDEALARLVFVAPTDLRLLRFLDDVDRWQDELQRAGLEVARVQQRGLRDAEVTHEDLHETSRPVALQVLFGIGEPRPSAIRRLVSLTAADPDAEGSVPIPAPDPDHVGYMLQDGYFVPDDVLDAEGSAPQRVILGLCESALTDARGATGAVGLGQAYVLAGARWALGTASKVEDQSAAAMVSGLIDAGVHRADAHAAAQALRAQQQRRREQGDPQWHQYRLWVR